MTDPWQVRTGTADDLDSLAPLWIAVHHRHVETMPELAPYVGDDETWRERRGLYAQLLDRLEAHLRGRGATDLVLGVLPGNGDAIRLYRRRGYRPTWLYLSKFEGRQESRSRNP